MATVSGRGSSIANGVHRQVWEGIGDADVGSALSAPQYPDKTVQVLGTFGSATVVIQGSNDGGTTWATLTDPQGNNLDFTSAGVNTIAENPQLIRPSSSGGTGTDVDVIIVSQSNKR